jgi:two-component system, chemotaxis family, chemotaxis protein CheY
MSELRALVVDDSQAMRKSIVYALQRLAGVRCEEAEDGAQALRKFSESPYEIVITDINMPLMDGLKLIHSIRSLPDAGATPIVVITTESAAADRARALALGANVYLVKPIQAGQVITAVKELLKLP